MTWKYDPITKHFHRGDQYMPHIEVLAELNRLQMLTTEQENHIQELATRQFGKASKKWVVMGWDLLSERAEECRRLKEQVAKLNLELGRPSDDGIIYSSWTEESGEVTQEQITNLKREEGNGC